MPSQVERIDAAVDAWFDRHLRGRPVVDRVMYTASAVGDHGMIWLALALIQAGRRPAQRRATLLRAAGGLAVESALVNGPVKWVFRRTRPVHEGPRPLRLRTPRTSSFPSGHASSAFFGAALLRDGDLPWPVYYAIALVVAASRVHVRIHHASDVVAGSLLGAALGEVARQVAPIPPGRSGGSSTVAGRASGNHMESGGAGLG
jgi:undecaprenyl-diphosphatase